MNLGLKNWLNVLTTLRGQSYVFSFFCLKKEPFLVKLCIKKCRLGGKPGPLWEVGFATLTACLHPDFLLYFYKCRHGFFQMFLLVCGG